MAAPMCLTKFRGQIQTFLQSGRLFPLHLKCKFYSSITEDAVTDNDLDEEEIKKKLAKIRDCSGLNQKQKLQYYGNMRSLEDIFARQYRGKKRNKLRRLYAEYGKESGIKPGIMFPSKAELSVLWDTEKNWTESFQQMKENLENKKAAEEEADRLRYEKIEKAMAGMSSLIKQYKHKQKKVVEDEIRRDAVEELLDEFKLQYGFNVTAKSRQFKAFKHMKTEELREIKAKQRREEKKATSIKRMKEVLEKEVKSKAENN